MKKLIVLTLLMLSIITGFSQVKHNKFSTRVKFAQFNPTFEFFKTIPSEIGDNSGYFLTNFYDDHTYGFHPSLVKLDVDGNIVFDSVYQFTPVNLSGYTSVKSTVTNSSSHTALYQTGSLGTQMQPAAPYVINFDLNGNVNWHVGFTDDTLDIEVYNLIHTQDGGYAIIGTMNDWYSMAQKPAGVIMKLDNGGNMLWHNLYTNKDSMEVKFKTGIETPDGGFFAVGDAPNFVGGARILGPFDVAVTMCKTDNAGNTIWSKAMELDNPVDMAYGFGNFSTEMINDTDAFVSYMVYDTTAGGTEKFAITSVNVNNGNSNWTKIYSLPAGQNVSVRQATADGNGNIIVSASDYNHNTGVLFHIDDAGNFIGSKRFVTFTYAHFPYHTIPTLDGGFMHVSEIDLNDVLVVKTDKTLDPSCPDIDSVYAFSLTPTLNLDTSYFGMIDTVYSLANLNPVQLTQGSPFNTVSDDSLICSCSNTVYGNVTEGVSTPVNNAKVYLFRKGVVPKPWKPIDSTLTDVAGNYTFNYVPSDSFLVRVEADTSLFPGAITSYFKEPVWCYRWDSAGVFHVHCDSSSIQKDVKLVVPAPLLGNSSLNGYIFESAGSFSKQMVPGDPIPGIDITVEQSPGGVKGASLSGGNGYYSLPGLDNNATYIVTVDFPGLPLDSFYTMNINFNDTILDSLNFYIDSTGIYILEDSFGVGVNTIETDNLTLDVYPNPSTDNFNLNIYATKPDDIILELIDEFGKLMTVNTESLHQGENNLQIKADHLPAGVYFLKIKEGQRLYTKKLIKL